jgi:hypothetical protein
MAQLTQDELEQFRSFRQEANKLAGALGELHFQRTLIDLELDKIKAAVQANTGAQQDQLRQLGDKYGDGSINIETGEITAITAN